VIRDPTNPMSPRIQQHVERLVRSRVEILDESNRKRAYQQPPASDYNDAKRQKMDNAVAQIQIPLLPPGSHSLAALFTVTNNAGLAGFDALQIPLELAAKINVKALATTSPRVLGQVIIVSMLVSLIR